MIEKLEEIERRFNLYKNNNKKQWIKREVKKLKKEYDKND